MTKVERVDWPKKLDVESLSPERIRESLEIYARVVSKEIPAPLRPKFQLKPDERARKIFQ